MKEYNLDWKEEKRSYQEFLSKETNNNLRKEMLIIADFFLHHELTERQRYAFARYTQGVKVIKIAKEMGITKVTVYKHIHTAKEKMKLAAELYALLRKGGFIGCE